jgi:hypothetical protein
MNCMSCKFAADKDKGALKCHRYPSPVIKNRDGWCGEFIKEEGNYEKRIPKKPAVSRLSQD